MYRSRVVQRSISIHLGGVSHDITREDMTKIIKNGVVKSSKIKRITFSGIVEGQDGHTHNGVAFVDLADLQAAKHLVDYLNRHEYHISGVDDEILQSISANISKKSQKSLGYEFKKTPSAKPVRKRIGLKTWRKNESEPWRKSGIHPEPWQRNVNQDRRYSFDEETADDNQFLDEGDELHQEEFKNIESKSLDSELSRSIKTNDTIDNKTENKVEVNNPNQQLKLLQDAFWGESIHSSVATTSIYKHPSNTDSKATVEHVTKISNSTRVWGYSNITWLINHPAPFSLFYNVLF